MHPYCLVPSVSQGPARRPYAFKSPEEGAAGTVYLATLPEVEGKTGGYYEDMRLVASNPISYDQEAIERLWRTSEKYVGLA